MTADEGKAEPVAWIADLIRNEYDKAPDLGSASYPAFEREWDDGAESIARKIVARPMHPPAQPAPAVDREALRIVKRMVEQADALARSVGEERMHEEPNSLLADARALLAQPAPAVDREAINDLDDVVRELGIESSHVTPAEAVRALYDERDDWSQRYATLAEAATALLATTPDERQSPAVWFPRVDAVKAALLPRAQPSSEEGGKDAELVRELRDEAMRLSGHSLDRGCVDSGIASNLADRAADRIESLLGGQQ